MDMSTIPVLGSVADCFSASRWRRLASSTSTVSTLSEKRTLACASASRIRDSSCRGYADTMPLPLPIFLMSTYACKGDAQYVFTRYIFTAYSFLFSPLHPPPLISEYEQFWQAIPNTVFLLTHLHSSSAVMNNHIK